MTTDRYEYPRLCGGTFMTLVIQALRQRMTAREHYAGESDGLTNPELLVGLIKVINPGYQNPGKEKLKGIANNYKACKSSTSVHLPFDDAQVISAFDKTVRTSYHIALDRMNAFADKFIDMDENVHKDIWLVRAIVDLIIQDKSIDDNEIFYIGANGKTTKKSELPNLKEICFPSFLLGVWHYIVIDRKNNSVGQQTYDKWCPSVGRRPRNYTAHMGEGVLEDVKIIYIDAKEKQASDFVETDSGTDGDTEEPASVQQNINSPFVFNFTQNGNNNKQIAYIKNYYEIDEEK